MVTGDERAAGGAAGGDRFLRVGVTGDEIDRIVHAATLERGAYPSPLNYYRSAMLVVLVGGIVVGGGVLVVSGGSSIRSIGSGGSAKRQMP